MIRLHAGFSAAAALAALLTAAALALGAGQRALYAAGGAALLALAAAMLRAPLPGTVPVAPADAAPGTVPRRRTAPSCARPACSSRSRS